MKTTLKFIVMVLVAAFYGCQKNDITTIAGSSISNDGVLSGTILNDSNRIDSIKLYDVGLLGESNVSSAGYFSVMLTTPSLHKIGSHIEFEVSDTTAMVGYMNEFDTFKDGIYAGYVYKSNSIDGRIGGSVKAGVAKSEFVYSDRPVTIQGSQIGSETNSGTTTNFKLNYNVTFKKGWTEIVSKIDSYSTTSKSVTIEGTVSNTITSDLQWRYVYINGSSYLPAKTRGVHDVTKQGLLF